MAFNARLVFQALDQWADWKTWVENQGNSDGYYLLGIPDDLNDLFQQAYNDGARIHTNSWGGATDLAGNSIHGQYTTESQDIDEFIWNHKDMIILFAAGNKGRDANTNGVVDVDSLLVQSCAKNCITVGASENNRATGGYNPGGVCNSYGNCWPADFPTNPLRDDRLSDDPEGMVAFSSRGPTDDGRIKPDVVAPGTNILSVRSSVASENGWGLLPAGDPNRPHYMYMGGTSMAAPLTAGTVALIRQYLMKVHLHTPSAGLLKAMLIHGATPMTGQYTPSEVGAVPDINQGWGRVNLEGSLFPDFPVKLEFKDDSADALGTGTNVTTQAATGEKQDFALVVGAGLDFVDVYIKDKPADHGVPPSRGCLYESPDIWVSLDNDPSAPPADNPEFGQTNYVFVKVHNRGSKVANNSEVKLYWAKGGTNLSRPYWKTDGIKVDGVAGNMRQVSVAAHTVASDGEAITAAFEWSPEDPASYTIEPGHFCFFATVSHPEDPLLQEDVDAVRWEDNLAWKNVNVKDIIPGTTTSMEFYVAGVEGTSSTADLHIDRSSLPVGGSVNLKIHRNILKDSTYLFSPCTILA